MKMLLSCCVGCAVMLACIAYADIPDYVDFHAIQSDPFDGVNQPTWDIVTNKFRNDDPVWNFGGSQLYIDDKSSGLQVRQLWLQIEFVDADAADPWKDEMNDGVAPYFPAAYGFDQDDNIIVPESVTVDVHDKLITWEWVFIFQPDHETVEFSFDVSSFTNVGTFDYDDDGHRDIEQLAVASHVIPAPASLLLCGIGLGCTVLARRFRR